MLKTTLLCIILGVTLALLYTSYKEGSIPFNTPVKLPATKKALNLAPSKSAELDKIRGVVSRDILKKATHKEPMFNSKTVSIPKKSFTQRSSGTIKGKNKTKSKRTFKSTSNATIIRPERPSLLIEAKNRRDLEKVNSDKYAAESSTPPVTLKDVLPEILKAREEIAKILAPYINDNYLSEANEN